MASHLVGQNQIATFITPVNGTSPIDANQVRGNDNSIKTAYNFHDLDPTLHIQDSTIGARPVAGVEGRKWMTTDTGGIRLWFDTGAAWQELSYLSSSAGGVFTARVGFINTAPPQVEIGWDDTHKVQLSVVADGTFTLTTINATPFFFGSPISQFGTNTAAGAFVAINGAAGNARGLRILSANVNRWSVQAGASAEAGGNVGSDFIITAYTDGGAAIDIPITIPRPAGSAVTVARPLVATSTLNVAGVATLASAQITTSLDVTGAVSIGGLTTLASLAVTGAATVGTTLAVTGATTIGGNLTVSGITNSVNRFLAINGAAGTARDLQYQTAGVARWQLRTSSTAEGGGNAGSPFVLMAFDDTGVNIDSPISIVRAAGGAITFARTTVGSLAQLTQGVQWTNAAAALTGINGVHVELLPRRAAVLDNTYAEKDSGFIYLSNTGGTALPFTQAGHVVFQSRVASPNTRDFYFVAQDPATRVALISQNGQVFTWSAGADEPEFRGNRSNGTMTVPLATTSGRVLLRLAGYGYQSVTPAFTVGGKIEISATEAWTDLANGCKLDFFTTPNGTAVPVNSWSINNTGHLVTPTDNVNDLGQAATRPRNVFIGTSCVIGVDPGGALPLRVGGGINATGGLTASGVSSSFGADAGASLTMNINSAAAGVRAIRWLTASSLRWSLRTNATAEGGGNAGSDFELVSNTDAGAAIDTPFSIARVGAGAVVLGGAGTKRDVILAYSGGALALTDVTGFPRIPTCAGTPTGAAASGSMVLDTTASKIWFRVGATWKGVVVA